MARGLKITEGTGIAGGGRIPLAGFRRHLTRIRSGEGVGPARREESRARQDAGTPDTRGAGLPGPFGERRAS